MASAPGPNLEAAQSNPSLHAHPIDMSRTPSPLADIQALFRWIVLLRSLRPDVVIFGSPKASLLGLTASLLAGVRVRVYEVHGLRFEGARGWKRSVLQLIEAVTCATATLVIPVSFSVRNVMLASRIVTPSKTLIVGSGSPNGVDVSHFQRARRSSQHSNSPTLQELRIDPDRDVVTFIGRLTSDKGLSALATALTLTTARFQLLVVGPVDDNSGAEGLRLLRKTGVPVIMTGIVEDVAPYLAISDVLCLPSRREGLPTVILEAFAAGVAVVATQATGIIDLVRSGQTGLLVPIDDPAALAAALDAILADQELRNDLAANANYLVTREFDQDVVHANWMCLLDGWRTEADANHFHS